jgi:hypothetical protein
VAAQPVARVWPVMLVGVPFWFVRRCVATHRNPLLHYDFTHKATVIEM